MEVQKKRLYIVTELFYPDETSTAYILTKIANKMIQKYEVHVISSPVGAHQKRSKTSLQVDEEVAIDYIAKVRLNNDKLLSRLLRSVLLSWRLRRALMEKLCDGDCVLLVTNPALLLLFVFLLKRRKRNNYTILVHDIFPENTIPSNIFSSKGNVLYKFLKCLFDKAYSEGDKFIVLGRDMKQVLLDKIGSNRENDVSIIENWADCVSIQAKSLKHENIIIQYAGNLGRVQGLMSLLSIIKKANNNHLFFSFYGKGAVKDDMIAYVAKNNLENVLIQREYRRDEQNDILNQCDIAIVTLAEGMYGLGVPSKAYNIMAAGKAILFLGDLNSEVAMMVKEHGIGFSFDAADERGLLNFLSSLNDSSILEMYEMGRKARIVAEKYYSEETILSKIENIL